MAVNLKSGSTTIFGGTVGVSGSSVTFKPTTVNEDWQVISFTKGTTASLTHGLDTLNITAKADTNFFAWRNDKNVLYLKLDEDSADFDLSLTRGGQSLINSSLTFGGSVTYSPADSSLALIGNTAVGNSFVVVKLGDYTIKTETIYKTVIIKPEILDDGSIFISFPTQFLADNDFIVAVKKVGSRFSFTHRRAESFLERHRLNC